MALCSSVITGIRIKELLSLKFHKREALFKESWIDIERAKRDSSSHKVFLTTEGKRVIYGRQKGFKLFF